ELLGDDPARIVDVLKAAIRAGAAPADLSRSLTYAAALRVARFGSANEHADWETAHHVFTYANAVDQMLKRIGTANPDGHVAAVRSVLHGAMALYLTRYLNVPPARIPGEGGEQLDELPADAEMIRATLLDAFDRQRQVDLAARLVTRHLSLGHSPQIRCRRGQLKYSIGFFLVLFSLVFEIFWLNPAVGHELRVLLVCNHDHLLNALHIRTVEVL